MDAFTHTMDTFTQAWELAEDAAQELAVIATKLAIKESHNGLSQKAAKASFIKNLGLLAGYLQIIAVGCAKTELGGAETASTQDASLFKFLESLERLCTYPRGLPPLPSLDSISLLPKQFPTLYGLTSKIPSGTILVKLETALGSFFRSHQRAVKSYFSFLNQFSARINSPGDSDLIQTTATSPPHYDSPNDLPSHVQETLYRILAKYTPQQCCCLQFHESRLRLKDPIRGGNDNGTIAFDTVISRHPPVNEIHEIEWQHLQFQIPKKSSRKRAVAFATNHEESPSVFESTRADDSISVESHLRAIETVDHFCTILGERIGPAKILLKVKNETLERVPDPDEIEDDIAQEHSVPLTAMLEKTCLASRKKLILAYILANSFWKFYGSDWMASRWTAESVHFFRRGQGNDEGDEDSLSDSFLEESPYFSLTQTDNAPLLADYLETGGYLHRYPRLLALGAILVEIGRQKRMKGANRTKVSWFNSVEETNQCFYNIKRALDSARWPELDLQEEARKVYRTVVEDCSNPKIFQNLINPLERQDGLTVDERRAIIYRKIVLPLRNLLEKFEWVDKSGQVLDSNLREGPSSRGTATLLNTSDHQNTSRDKAELWLRKIQESEVTRSLCASFKQNRALGRIRVAVLDTGYDPSSIFFKAPDRRRRIQAWKDYVSSDSLRLDVDGHGTHVLSLMMKVAPAADIYVARVARGTPDLASSTLNIAEAILWAAKDCQADIISMSFGFDEEIFVNGEPAISNAISEALKVRNQRIIFFAAAANEGGNQPEMFPAKHPYVISMRGTDDKGWLQRFNPPPDYDGASCFMTLGQDVPGAALDRNGGGEVCKSGTSVSTPIAAGIAAMLLGYARLYEDELKQNFRPGEAWKSSQLWTMTGMRKLFGMLSTEMLDRWSYLSAERFLHETHELRICLLSLIISGRSGV
ncbi:hypothetical protein QBC43DRAFT_306849 [Cladorrhinum sp. PSN259]|nr:hypothetical protein QBC43DRAFT_306849 [Cladorrhinum sp. PSN259]